MEREEHSEWHVPLPDAGRPVFSLQGYDPREVNMRGSQNARSTGRHAREPVTAPDDHAPRAPRRVPAEARSNFSRLARSARSFRYSSVISADIFSASAVVMN